MSSDEEPDLPVAALVLEDNTSRHFNIKAKIVDWAPLETSPGDELVRKSDAEAAIAKERSTKYDEGFFEGRQTKEEEILDKIEKKVKQVDRFGELYGSEMNADMIKNELEELRDQLKEEVEEA